MLLLAIIVHAYIYVCVCDLYYFYNWGDRTYESDTFMIFRPMFARVKMTHRCNIRFIFISCDFNETWQMSILTESKKTVLFIFFIWIKLCDRTCNKCLIFGLSDIKYVWRKTKINRLFPKFYTINLSNNYFRILCINAIVIKLFYLHNLFIRRDRMNNFQK